MTKQTGRSTSGTSSKSSKSSRRKETAIDVGTLIENYWLLPEPDCWIVSSLSCEEVEGYLSISYGTDDGWDGGKRKHRPKPAKCSERSRDERREFRRMLKRGPMDDVSDEDVPL